MTKVSSLFICYETMKIPEKQSDNNENRKNKTNSKRFFIAVQGAA